MLLGVDDYHFDIKKKNPFSTVLFFYSSLIFTHILQPSLATKLLILHYGLIFVSRYCQMSYSWVTIKSFN